MIKENFKIVRLAEGDVKCKSDHLSNFQKLILGNQTMYPEIERWFAKKVLPGIRENERVAFVGYLDEKPTVSAVVKKGSDAKFCHLRIDESLRGSNLGDVFFSLMALEIRDAAESIHFTLPESVWAGSGGFFTSFGFAKTEIAPTQYRLFDREFACRASYKNVWDSVLMKIPKLVHRYAFGGFTPDSQLLISVKPEFAERILSGKKTVELRKKFSTRWSGHRMNLYASAPVMSMVGEARISKVVVNRPEVIWEQFNNSLGCTRAEFDDYTSGADEVYALELDEVLQYRDRFPLVQMEHLLNEQLAPPQSYVTLEKNRPWARAVSIAAYLHGCLKSTVSLSLDASSLTPSQRADCYRTLPSESPLLQGELI